MAPRSTARHLSYDLRPAKQAERLIILDVLKAASDVGLPISDYRYVGMGANRFYDFLLIHKYLGLKKMISLEHDPAMYKRAVFNAPYSFIDVRPDPSATFIGTDSYVIPTITWFDYDGGISSRIVTDILNLGTKLQQGDFLFVTTYGGPPKVLAPLNDSARIAWLQDNMTAVSGQVTVEDVETASFPDAVHKILLSSMRNAFSVRRDGQFYPIIQIEYSDSTPMITVGGAFLAEAQFMAMKKKIRYSLPFLNLGREELYEIRSLHLTERERGLFDRAVTKSTRRSSERNALKAMGFSEKDLGSYSDLIRFLPRYVETMV